MTSVHNSRGFVGSVMRPSRLLGSFRACYHQVRSWIYVEKWFNDEVDLVFLALLMIVLPVLLRFLGWYENIPLKSLLSVSVYKRYYAFLVMLVSDVRREIDTNHLNRHGFLIVTFTSAISATIWTILQTPAKAVEDLAQRLPEASIFFLTYMGPSLWYLVCSIFLSKNHSDARPHGRRIRTDPTRRPRPTLHPEMVPRAYSPTGIQVDVPDAGGRFWCDPPPDESARHYWLRV